MRSISKYFAFAAAMTALASCSDDLGLGSNGLQENAGVTLEAFGDGDAFTRMGMKEGGQDVYGGDKTVVWATGDKIRVFTLDKLSQDIYQLSKGAGSQTGEFVRTQETGLIGDKYAITEADMVYGVSAAEIDGEILPRLTLTLPREYTPGVNADGNQKFPIPYWGAATVSEGAEKTTVSAMLSGMTAFLRIHIGELPAGTKSIVLTTHGGGIFDKNDGFILAPFGKNVQDTKAGWYGTFTGNNPVDLPAGHEWIKGGYSEALTGTLNTILKPGCELAIDERLVHSDEMVINLTNVKNQVIYVPIVCGDYRNLHVIAASKVSENYRYCYAGTELNVFQDATFERNHCYYLNMNLVNLGKACIGKVNQAIKKFNGAAKAGMTTIINVDELVYDPNAKHNEDGGHKNYTDDKIKFDGLGNVILNIKKVGDNQNYGKNIGEPLKIEDVYELVGATSVPKDAKGYNRFLEVNLPNMEGDKFYYEITTPLSDLYLGTIDGVQADKLQIKVNGSNTMFKQYEDMSIIARDATMQHEEYAAVNIKNGFDFIEISDQTKGDVYAYTDGLQAQEETEINTLKVSSKGQQGFRFDDALIAELWFAANNATGDRQVFTTGSTAIKSITNGTQEVAFDAKTPTGANTPSRVHMYALWTGKALTESAILKGYDVKEVWTAAQLSSIGEGIYPATFEEDLANVYAPGKNQAAVLADLQALLGGGTLPAVSEYWIPTQLVRLVWLGDDIYPWMGARVRAQNFKLHGEKVELKNMNFLAKWPNGVDMIADDPHWCCTSCWTPDVTAKYLNLSNFVGLMRFIANTTEVLVEDINLNDVELSTPLKKLQKEGELDVNYMGSIAGAVASKKTTFQNNHVGEVKIATFGDFVGGMVGAFINFDGTLDILNNDVFGVAGNVDGGVVGGNNVGGLAGFVYASGGLAQLNDNKVRMDYLIFAAEDNAGGLVGSLAHNDGNVEATDNLVSMGEPNDVASIYAGNQYAGGLFGRAAVGLGTNNFTEYLQIKSADVYVSGAIRAENGYVGGEVGQMYLGKIYAGVRTLAGLDIVKRDFITNIDVKTLAGKYAVGGLVGNNTQSQKCPMFVTTGFAPSEDYESTINITINEFENTKTVADFGQDENIYFGTMSNVLGYMEDDLTIIEDNLNVVDHLQSEMKEAVLYKYHWDNTHTVADIQNQKYWGDGNGYVGWRSNGYYSLNNTIHPGEVIDPYGIEGHNVFKTPARYGEKSKNAVE